jgi:hypothetical protein
VRDELRAGLAEAYKHRSVDGAACAACGRASVPLALHVVEFWHPDSVTTPASFVPMSRSRGIIRGGVPVCTICCPPCRKCGLPVVTPWTRRLVTALATQNQGTRILNGNGFCRHVHLFGDLRSLFRSVKLPATKPRGPSQTLSSAKPGSASDALTPFFVPKPRDPAWQGVTQQNAEYIQQGFLAVWQEARLDRYTNTNALTGNDLDIIARVADEIGARHNVNQWFIILISHQYIDADPLMRQTYRTRWLASMVARSTYAPPPESYTKYIQDTYFRNSES